MNKSGNRSAGAIYRDVEGIEDYLASSVDLFWETDAELRFTAFHGPTRDVLGLSEERLIGKSVYDQSGTILSSGGWDACLAFMDSRQPIRNLRFVGGPSQGEKREFLICAVPYFDAESVFAGYCGTMVGTRDRDDGTLAILSDTLDALDIGVVISDSAEKVVLSNRKYLEIYPEIADLIRPGVWMQELLEAFLDINRPDLEPENREKLLMSGCVPFGRRARVSFTNNCLAGISGPVNTD